MVKAKSFDYDFNYLQAGLEILEDYLLSDDIFWPIGANPPKGEPDYPRLTLDGMLLSQTRAAGQPKSVDQLERYERLISDLMMKRAKWRVAWEKKAGVCFRLRLRMWGDFLKEFQDSPEENADRYPYEVRLRVMLQLLIPEIGAARTEEGALLTSMDAALKSRLLPGSFIWEAQVQAGFPPSEYWYLYGRLLASAQ